MQPGSILKSHREVYLIENSFFMLELKLFFVILIVHLLTDVDTIVQEKIVTTFNSSTPVGYFILYNLFLFVITLILISKIVMNWVFHRYFIDTENKRLYEENGFFRISERMHDLSQMNSITLNQSFFGRMFRYGSIEITVNGFGSFQDTVTLKNISNPSATSMLLKGILKDQK